MSFSIIKPSSFVTGVHGNDTFLFGSYSFWFGWPFVLIIALLPRYLIRVCRQNFFPDDIDLMRLVRRFHPDVDPATHPMMGGKLAAAAMGKQPDEDVVDNSDEIRMKELNANTAAASESEYARKRAEEEGIQGRPSIGLPRSSMTSARLGMHGSARGSQVDSESSYWSC